jgi:hypothetical protein
VRSHPHFRDIPFDRELDFQNGATSRGVSIGSFDRCPLDAGMLLPTSVRCYKVRIMDRPQRRRKFVDSSVQGALARRVIFHWLLFLAVASAAALMLQVLSDPFRPASEHLANVWYTQGPFLIVMIFLLPVFVVDTIKISHRFAGPIHSLRRTMRGVASGETPQKLQFRKQDFWHELADDYNAMIARLVPSTENRASSDEESKTPESVAR